MKPQKGFTIAEYMLAGAVIGIIIAAAGPRASSGAYKLPTDTNCIAGYKHNTNTGAQIFDANGGGIPCGVN